MRLLAKRVHASIETRDLIRRCQRGDTLAIEALIRRYQNYVFRLCVLVMRNEQDAEDMTQEFFVKLFRNAARYQPRGHFTTYFYRVLANLCFDLLRKRKRRRKVQSVQLDPIAAEGTELEPLTQHTDPDASLRQQEAHGVVHECLSDLPTHVRMALELREFEGLRYREIAEP